MKLGIFLIEMDKKFILFSVFSEHCDSNCNLMITEAYFSWIINCKDSFFPSSLIQLFNLPEGNASIYLFLPVNLRG